MQKYTLQPSRCAGKGGVWICLLVLILICIGTHSVKSDTKCIRTMIQSTLVLCTRRKYEQRLISLSTQTLAC